MPYMDEKLWNDADIQNNGLFALYRREFGKLLLDAAARVDFNRASSGEMKLVKMGNVVYQETDVKSSYTNFSASLGGQYHFSEKFSLKLSFGRGVRSPDMNERFIMFLPIGYDNYDYLGNPQLKPEVNNEADLSATLNFEKAGTITGGFFFSYVTEYITAELVPESVAKPQTKGVYGVKQFYNEDHVYLRGFELTYQSPASKMWGVKLQAACTKGINPEATKYIIENGQVTGSETIKNDPLPEIPPLEGSIDLSYKFLKAKLIPVINVRMVSAQNNISEAYLEAKSPGFALLNFYLSYDFNKYLKVTGGVSNILDEFYYEHLNRRIIGGQGNLYEPGRSFYINLYFKI
jgi:iron complex outermembrane receptor protein